MTARWVAALLVLTTAGCGTSAPETDDYAEQAGRTRDAVLSEVGTAEVAVEQLRSARLPQPYADTTVSAAEQAIGTAAASFGTIQPPRAADDLRQATTVLVTDAEEAVAAARIAVRRSDAAALATAAAELARVRAALAAGG
jgi:hypothetical protein